MLSPKEKEFKKNIIIALKLIEKNNAITRYYSKNSDYLSDTCKIRLQRVKKDLVSLLYDLDKRERDIKQEKKKKKDKK